MRERIYAPDKFKGKLGVAAEQAGTAGVCVS
jgi:hypothetical protein